MRLEHPIEAVAVATSTTDKVLAHYAYSHLMTLFWWDGGDDDDDDAGVMSKYLGSPDSVSRSSHRGCGSGALQTMSWPAHYSYRHLMTLFWWDAW